MGLFDNDAADTGFGGDFTSGRAAAPAGFTTGTAPFAPVTSISLGSSRSFTPFNPYPFNVRYADPANVDPSVPVFVKSRDIMKLDADPDGARTVKWGQATGSFVGKDYVAGLNVFGRPMSRDQLMSSEAGRELLDIASKNRRGERRGFFEAVSDVGWKDLPFVALFASVGGSIMDARMVSDTMHKLQNGDAVTDEELLKTRLYLAKQERDAQGTWGATVGDIIRQAPGFATEIYLTGGIAGAARAGAAKATGMATAAGTRLAVGSGVKKLAQEVVEHEIVNKATQIAGASATKKAVTEAIRGFSEATTKKLAADLATSITKPLVEDLTRTFGAKYVAKLGDEALGKMAENVARTATARALSYTGASNAFTKFMTGLGQAAKDWTVRGFLDHGAFGTPTSTVFFSKYNKAGAAVLDAFGKFVVEAPLRGSLQFGLVFGANRAGSALLGYDPVLESQLALESTALMTGNKELMAAAHSIALASSLMEYVSENTGAGFSSLFRGVGLATGLAKQAPRAFVGELGSILTRGTEGEAGGVIRGLIRKAMPTVEDMASRTKETRMAAVRSLFKASNQKVDSMTVSRIVSGDLTGLSPEIAAIVGNDVGKFLKRATKEYSKARGEGMLARAGVKLWAADYMVRHQLTPDKLMNALHRFGYDGIIEEMAEERYVDFFNGLFGWDDKGRKDLSSRIGQAFRNIWVGPGGELDASQLAAEAVAFAVPMLVRASSLRIQRAVGGGGALEDVRRTARAAQNGLRAMDVVEVKGGEYLASARASSRKLREKRKALLEERQAIIDAAAANGVTSQEELAKLTAKVDDDLGSIDKRRKAQLDMRRAVLNANGPETFARINRDNMIFVPVTNLEQSSDDLKSKLHADPNSDQLAEAAGERAAAIENAWKIGRAQALALGSESDWEAPWYRRWAAKAVGIVAATVTGEPALAFRNYAGWAAADEGLDPRLASQLLLMYQVTRTETIKKMASNITEKGAHIIPEEAVWENMKERYKREASAVMANHFAVANARMVASTDMVDQAIIYLARREGWTADEDAAELTRERDGKTESLSFQQFHENNRDKVDKMRGDIAEATFRLIADTETRRLDNGAVYALAYLPTTAQESTRTAYAIAMQLSGMGSLVSARNLDGNLTLEQAVESGSQTLTRSVTKRIVAAVEKNPGEPDYTAPSDKDIIELASMLGYSVNTGSDKELAELRQTVIDVARQIEGVAPEKGIVTFSTPVNDAVLSRLYGKPAVTVNAILRADGKWYATLTRSDGEFLSICKSTPEEILAELKKHDSGFERVDRGVVITDVANITSDDPFILVQQLGLAPEYLKKTSRPDGDQSALHPALRTREDGTYVYATMADVRRQLLVEAIANELYERYGDDLSQYPGENDQQRTVAHDNARKIHENTRGEHGYLTVMDNMLKDAGVIVPGTALDTDAGMLFGARGKYMMNLRGLVASRNSAVTYVHVNSLHGQDDSSALLVAALDTAFVRNSILLRKDSRLRGVVVDFLQLLDQIALRRLSNSDTSAKEAEALRAMRSDITVHAKNPTRRAFVEAAQAFCLFMTERDRELGKLSSAHSLAFQTIADEVYQTPQFLRFYGLVDLMLGGDAMASEAARQRWKVSDTNPARGLSDRIFNDEETRPVFVPVRGTERLLALFHRQGVDYLKNFIGGFKPFGLTYKEFVAEVNRQAQTLNLKPRAADAEGAQRSRSSDLYKSVIDAFYMAGCDTVEDFNKMFKALARTKDMEFRETARRFEKSFSNIIDSLNTAADRKAKELEKAEADLKKAIEARDREQAAHRATADELAAANKNIEELVEQVAQLKDRLEASTATIASLKAEDTLRKDSEEAPEPKVRVVPGDRADIGGGETTKDGKVPAEEVETPSKKAEIPSNGVGDEYAALFKNEGEPEEFSQQLKLNTDGGVDYSTAVHLEIDSKGELVLATDSTAARDITDDTGAYAGRVFRNLANVLGFGATTSAADFRALLRRIMPDLSEAEVIRLEQFFLAQQRTNAPLVAKSADAEEDDDNEGTHSEGNRGFTERELAAYTEQQLNAFLGLANLSSPETGRNIQAFMNLLREDVRRLAKDLRKRVDDRVEASKKSKMSVDESDALARDEDLLGAVETLDRILNPRARTDVDTEEAVELKKRIAKLEGDILPVDTEGRNKTLQPLSKALKDLRMEASRARSIEARARKAVNDLRKEKGKTGEPQAKATKKSDVSRRTYEQELADAKAAIDIAKASLTTAQTDLKNSEAPEGSAERKDAEMAVALAKLELKRVTDFYENLRERGPVKEAPVKESPVYVDPGHAARLEKAEEVLKEAVDKLRDVESRVAAAQADYDRTSAELEETRVIEHNKSILKQIDALKSELLQLLSAPDREALWRAELNGLDEESGYGHSRLDDIIKQLAPFDAPVVSRNAVLLLGFLKSCTPDARIRLLTLCANSAVCSRAVVDFAKDDDTGDRDKTGGIRIEPRVGTGSSLCGRAVASSFMFLTGFTSPRQIDAAIDAIRAAVLSGKKVSVGAGASLSFTKRLNQIADVLEPIFGHDNPLIRMLRSDGLQAHANEVVRSASGKYAADTVMVLKRAATWSGKEDIPSLLQSVVNFLYTFRVQMDSEGAEAWTNETVKSRIVHRLCTSWLSYDLPSPPDANQGQAQGLTQGHKTMMISTEWSRFFQFFQSAQPLTMETSEFIEGRSYKTASKVVISARGLIPIVGQWMDKPLSDKTGFAYIAKNFMPGARGDALRAMSDSEFLETVLPECRQNLTWPDSARTPVLAKNLAKDYSPDAVFAACRRRFIEMVHDTKVDRKLAETRGYKSKEGLGLRWYVQLFAGEHSAATLLQLPRLAYVKSDGSLQSGSLAEYIPTAGFANDDKMFESVSTRINVALGMDKLGKDPKRAAVSSNQSPGVSVRGVKIVDGKHVFGETRVHMLLGGGSEVAFAKNEILLGGIFGVGYGLEAQRAAASDARSDVLKLHYMNASGEDIAMFKGLTLVSRKDSGKEYTPLAQVLFDHIIKNFRGSDSDISTSIVMDKDGYKVGLFNSKVMGVAVRLADGSIKGTQSLIDFLYENLKDVGIPAGGLDAKGVIDLLREKKGIDRIDWVALDSSGEFAPRNPKDPSGKEQPTLADILPEGLRLHSVEGLNGKAMDLSFTDNSLMSYTVANVSHEAKPSVGRMPRNLTIDALTMAAVQLRAMKDKLTGPVKDSAEKLLDLIANWGLMTTAVTTDESLAEACRVGTLQSEGVKELIEGEGEDPHSLRVNNQLAYDVMKKITRNLNMPMFKLDCALITGGAAYNDAAGSVGSLVADPFYRYCSRGSRVYGKANSRWRGTSRSLGLAQINVRSDGFRYGWHLDREAFAKAYGVDAAAGATALAEKIEAELVNIRRLDRAHAAAIRALGEQRRLPAAMQVRAETLRLGEAVKDAAREARDARTKFASCFTDHYGQRVSDMKCRYEHRNASQRSPLLSDMYCHSVCFDDLFIAGGADGRKFDRSAVHFGDAALRLDKKAAAVAKNAKMAEDTDPVFLAGSTIGFPRTPSYNGSMWLQTLRAASYATADVGEDGSISVGRDAIVIPDAQSLKILGADHDGDKASCYMYSVDMNTGVATTTDIPGIADSNSLLMFDKDSDIRREYLDELVEAGLVKAPHQTGKGQGYMFLTDAKKRISNSLTEKLFDLARNTVVEQPEEDTDFYGTRLARATKARPVVDAMMKEIIAAAGDRAKFLAHHLLSHSESGANVSTSAMSADQARGQIVALASILHIARVSGRFNQLFTRKTGPDGKPVAENLLEWFDFIYGIDGISNATFDDIKEQLCYRLGWTSGMIETLVVDIMTSGEKAPTSDREFCDILVKYVKSVAGKGSRWYMFNASEAPEGSKERAAVHRAIRGMYRGWTEERKKAEPAKYAAIDPSGVVSRDSVIKFFGIKVGRSPTGATTYSLPDAVTALDPRAAAVVNSLKTAVAASKGEYKGDDAARWLVDAGSRRGGESAAAGYVYWLADVSGKTEEDAADFLRWAKYSSVMGDARDFAAAVNYTKADPGDPSKTGRRETASNKFQSLISKDVVGQDDAMLDHTFLTMNAAARRAYRASTLATSTSRAAIASNNRGVALSSLISDLLSGYTSNDLRELLTMLSITPTVPPSDTLTLESNMQTRPHALAVMLTMSKARRGTALFADVETTFATLKSVRDAVVAHDKTGNYTHVVGPYMATLEARRGLEALVGVIYALVSGSMQGSLQPAFAYITGHEDTAWRGRKSKKKETTEEDWWLEGDDTPSRARPSVRRVAPLYPIKDDSSLTSARMYVKEVLEGYFDSDRIDGEKRARRPLFDYGLSKTAKTFTLTLENLLALSAEYEKGGNKQMQDDIAMAIGIINKLAADRGVKPDEIVIEPSTVMSQVLPLLEATTVREGSNYSLLDLLPDIKARASKMEAVLYSGVLEQTGKPPQPGYALLDVYCATASGVPGLLMHADFPRYMSAGRLYKDNKDHVEKVLNSMTSNPNAEGNTALDAQPVRDAALAASGAAKADQLPGPGDAKAPRHRAQVDFLGADNIFRNLARYAESVVGSTEARLAEGVDLDIEAGAVEVSPAVEIAGEKPSDKEVKNLVHAVRCALGSWANVSANGSVITIRAKHGLKGSGAKRFAKDGVGMVLTVRIGGENTVDVSNLDPNSPAVAASFCEAAKGLGITPEEFRTKFTEAERRALLSAFVGRGGVSLAHNAPVAFRFTGKDLAMLAGEIRLGSADKKAFYHELFHAMVGMFRAMDVLGEEDIKILRRRFGDPVKGTNQLFNEEAAAEEFRRYAERRAAGSYDEMRAESGLGKLALRGVSDENIAKAVDMMRDEGGEARDRYMPIFRRMWEKIKSFLSALANGFSYRDKNADSFLFEMILTGTAQMSLEQTAAVEAAAAVSEGFTRLYRQELASFTRTNEFTPDDGAVDAKGKPVWDAAADAAARQAKSDFDSALSAGSSQSGKFNAKYGKTAAPKGWPDLSAGLPSNPRIDRLSNLLQNECRAGTTRFHAVRVLMQNLLAERTGAPVRETETGPEAVPSNEVSFALKVARALDCDPVSPAENKAAVYGPEQALGLAAVRLVTGSAGVSDTDLLRTVTARKTWSQLAEENVRYKEAVRDAIAARRRRSENVIRQGVTQFLRMSGSPATTKEEENMVFMALMAAAGFINSRRDPANARKKPIKLGDALASIRTTRGAFRISSAQYAGFLVAMGSHDAAYYLDGLRERLKAARDKASLGGTVETRETGIADHLLMNLARFDKFNPTTMVTEAGEWAAAVDEFSREVLSGTRRGPYDPAIKDFGPYTLTGDTDGMASYETPSIRERNKGIYQFSKPGADTSDDAGQKMLLDTVTTVSALTASVRFARELGVVPGSFLDAEFTAKNPPPLDALDTTVELRLARGDIADLDKPLIAPHLQPAFVLSNVDKWLEGSLPDRLGNLLPRDMMMRETSRFRGNITKTTMLVNWWGNYLGVSRSDNRKLLRIVERDGKFEMADGFFRRIEGKVKKYLGFDLYHGVAGQTVGVEFTEDEYRMVDLYLKALAARANGGKYYITGADKIRFTTSMKPSEFLRRDHVLTQDDVAKRIASSESITGKLPEQNRVIMALHRIGSQLPAEVLADRKYFRRLVEGIAHALGMAHGDLNVRLNDGGDMSENEFNDRVLGELERRGLVVAARDRDGLRATAAIVVPVADIEAWFKSSTAYEKLTSKEAGRDPAMLEGDYIIKSMMEPYYELLREVRKHPWLTAGDSKFLNNFATPLPFYQGTGNFMYHAQRAVRDLKVSTQVRLAKHEETYYSLLESDINHYKGVEDLTASQLRMLHDYFGTEEDGQDLLRAVIAGEYAPGTKKSADTGLEVDPAAVPYEGWLRLAGVIYRKQQERLLLLAEGKKLDDIDDADSLRRMIEAYEDAMSAGGTTVAGAAGMTDEQMYRLHGALPANMQLGHKIMTAMKGITDSLYRRSVLINMLFTKTADGKPVYYMNPSMYGAETSGIPDVIWAAAAKWWAHGNPGLKYDNAKTGVENARAMYGTLSSLYVQNNGKIGKWRYESMNQTDIAGQASVENVLCVRDDPSDENVSRLNTIGLAGEALGYAKHFFMADRAPGNAKLAFLDHVMAWTKSMNVMGSAFFPLATKWESPTAAVGALATLGSNLSPEFVRSHSGLISKLFGQGWIDENFIGFQDIVKMMDTNDPFLADIVMWAESMGITMSTSVRNPMETDKGYVARDIKSFQEWLREHGFGSRDAAKMGGVMEALFLRSGEKAFTYALNATKLAVTCQVAMKLRAQAKREGRAFDPIRDLGKYAAYIDTEIGGINPLRYAWLHPQMQAVLKRTMFSYEWTRSAWEAGGGHFFEDILFGGHSINKETRGYMLGRWLRMFGTVMIGVPMLMQMLIKGIALAAGRDDPDDKWFTWENEDKAWLTAYDITPLMKVVRDHEPVARLVSGALGALYGYHKNGGLGALVGGAVGAAGVPNYTGEDEANSATMNRRYYAHYGKQGWEYFRWGDKPVEQFFSKLSMTLQRALEGLLGRNPAYLDRELPLGEATLAERFLTPVGPKSAWWNMLKMFQSFVAESWSTFGDAGWMSYFGPVQMGASKTNINDRLEKALTKWALNDRSAYRYAAKATKKAQRARINNLVSDILDDARRNGIADTDEMVMRAVGQITPGLYAKLVKLIPMKPDDEVDEREIRRLARALLKLGSRYEQAKLSLEKRLKLRGLTLRDLPDETRERALKTLKSAFDDPYGVKPIDY